MKRPNIFRNPSEDLALTITLMDARAKAYYENWQKTVMGHDVFPEWESLSNTLQYRWVRAMHDSEKAADERDL